MAQRRTRRREYGYERNHHEQQCADRTAYRDPNHAAESPDDDAGNDDELESLLDDSLPELLAGRESVT